MSNNATMPPGVTGYRNIPLHEVVTLFDPLSDEQMTEMESSIRSRGIDQPIVLWNGMIIDGRNRWIAACNVGHEFKPSDFREWNGRDEDLLDYVWEINAKCRRHLKPSQLDALGVLIMEYKAKQIASSRGRSGGNASTNVVGKNAENDRLCDSPRNAAKEAADQVGRSERQIRQTARVKKESPEAFHKIRRGETTTGRAIKELGLPPGEHEVPVAPGSKAKKKIKSVDPDKVTRLEDVAADMEERLAMRDQDSDEVWVEGLPLYSQLSGKLQADFRKAAIAARNFWSGPRKDLVSFLSDNLPGNRKPSGYFYYFAEGLRQLPPEDWHVCPPMNEGGCEGAGSFAFGPNEEKCPECRGLGYVVPRQR